jgi:hypothetical protein
MIRGKREGFVGIADVWQLRQLGWPFMRLPTPHFVEPRALGPYMREVLATGDRSALRVVPRPDAEPSHPRAFAMFGQHPSSPAAVEAASEDRRA